LALAITGDEDVLDALPDETKGIVQVISAVRHCHHPRELSTIWELLTRRVTAA